MIKKQKQIQDLFTLDLPVDLKTIHLKKKDKSAFKSGKTQKYMISKEHLRKMLYQFSGECFLVENKQNYYEQYSTIYFDTPDLKMYFEQHNKKANRHKIYKKYKSSNEKSELVVKHIDNKDISCVKKIKTKDFRPSIPLSSFDYINSNTDHLAFLLKPVLYSSYCRYLFTNKEKNILLTIDAGIRFWNEHQETYLSDLVVATIKTKDLSPEKEITTALHSSAPVFPSGLNKYSIGMALTNPGLKQNLLKQKIHTIKTMC